MAGKQGISVQVIPKTKQQQIKRLQMLNGIFAQRLPILVAETGINIQKDAKREVQVDYGFLRASIYFDYKGKANQSKQGISNTSRRTGRTLTRQMEIPMHFAETTREGLTAYVGSDMDYAWKIELEVRPYLLPAFDRHAPRFERAVDNLIREAVKQ